MNEPSTGSSYERTLAAARIGLATARLAEPSVEALDRALDEGQRRAGRRLRGVWAMLAIPLVAWLASVFAHPIVSGLCPQTQARDVFELGLVPVLTTAASGVLVARPGLGAQLFARAAWWSGLLLGVAGGFGAPGLVPVGFLALALGSGGALLIARDHGLGPEQDRGGLVPSAYRTTLLVALLLAMADAQALLAINQANRWMHPFTAVCSLAMIVAVVGLYRMRGWGLLANVAVALTVGIAALTGHLGGVPRPFALVFVATAVAQLLLVVPLLRSLLRGELSEPSPWWRARLADSIIVVAMVAALVGALAPDDPDAVAAYCAQNFDLPAEGQAP